MNQYLIEHKIKTLSELSKPFDFEGFNFRQWDFNYRDGWLGDAWIAKKIIEEENVLKAINVFRKELASIVERMSFISQCFASMNLESYLIIKKNDNHDNVLFLFSSREAKGVPLHFNEKEKKDLNKIKDFERQAVFKYLNESTNATTYYTRLAMLVIVLESIASAMKKESGLTVKEYIEKEILKDGNLYQTLFAKGTGVRNRLFHGQEINIAEDYAGKIYKKIVEYFNSKYGLEINTGVISPQRNFTGNYAAGRAWLKPQDGIDKVDIKKAVEVFEMAYGSYTNRDSSEFDKMFLHARMPKDY